MNWAFDIRTGGVVRAFGLPTAAVDGRDIAAVAVRALLDEGHEGKTHTLTGPKALSPQERARILGEILGRDLRFEEQTPEQVREQMLPHTPAE